MVSRKANSSSSGRDAGGDSGRKRRSEKRVKPPLGEANLRDLALHYAARFATTGARLEAYLVRKIRERGLAQDDDGRTIDPDIRALVARLVELGYVDDDAYARSRARDLGARGYGARRVEETLRHAGVAEPLRQAHAPGEAASRQAAALMARKRRLGPYGVSGLGKGDPLAIRKAREKAVAAMLRAGHQYEHARYILAAQRPEDVEQWVGEAFEDSGDEEGIKDQW
ncbi:MAG: RecX family transcriptional regulator [Sphingomonadales bacterium]|nr:RecX family transcriptional regulator [Sphingomonadales bacterium]NCQ22033.1 RecX family transcriptional regulator [Sphingomonadales bacterium]NCT03672.1 RecX family transcriptional regulator [Sphingomonadales bacterium]